MMKKNSLVILFLAIIAIVFVVYFHTFSENTHCGHHHHHDIANTVISENEINPIVNIEAPLREYENLILFLQIVFGLAIFGIAFYIMKRNRKK